MQNSATQPAAAATPTDPTALDPWSARAEVAPFFFAALRPADADADAEAQALLVGPLAPLLEDLPPKGRVLDFGCGTGRFTAPMAARFAATVGYDPCPALCAVAEEAHPGVRFLAPLPAEDRFDRALAVGVLDLLAPERANAALARLAEAVEPGGRALFGLHLATDDAPAMAVPESADLMPRARSLDAWRFWLRSGGFETVRVAVAEADGLFAWPMAFIETERLDAAEAADLPAPSGPVPNEVEAPGEAEAEDATAFEVALLQHLAEVREMQGDRDGAEAALGRLCRLAPHEPQAWLAWAAHRLQRDDVKGAALLLAEGSINAPAHVETWLLRAGLALDMEDPAVLMATFEALADLPLDAQEKARFKALREAAAELAPKAKPAGPAIKRPRR